MPKPRKQENIGLPERWQFKHNAYYYRVPVGSEPYWNHKQIFRLGKTIEEARSTFISQIKSQPDYSNPDLFEAGDIFGISRSVVSSGLYFLFDGEEIVYVGRSSAIYGRLHAHCTLRCMKFDRIAYIPAPDDKIERLEQLYIGKFSPKYNVYFSANGQIL